MRPEQASPTVDLERPPFSFDDGDPYLAPAPAPASVTSGRPGLWLHSKRRQPMRLRATEGPARGIWRVP